MLHSHILNMWHHEILFFPDKQRPGVILPDASDNLAEPIHPRGLRDWQWPETKWRMGLGMTYSYNYDIGRVCVLPPILTQLEKPRPTSRIESPFRLSRCWLVTTPHY